MNFDFQTIGTIRSQYKQLADMPIQAKGSRDSSARVVIVPEFQDGLKDLEGFSHIYIIYPFHQSKGYELMVTPFLDNQPHGVFATRAPRRPNSIGLSIAKICAIQTNIIHLAGIDILDGTPVWDIKPYIERFDRVDSSRSGWMNSSEIEVKNKRSDTRFEG